MKFKEKEIIAICELGELFCGPGGLAWGATNADIGLDNHRIVHTWANDYDSDTCNMYRRNICPQDPDSVIWGDVVNLIWTVFLILMHISRYI